MAPIGPAPSITGNSSIDARIRSIGEGRGYIRRPLPAGPLVNVGWLQMQPDAAEAWLELRADAKSAGHTLLLASAYRDHSAQTYVLLRKLTSYTDAAIDARLRYVAPTGYSKHHTGYAVDITQPGYEIFEFVNSPAYAWLSANNYETAKRHGWIPSYPPDATNQGPRPEPWEWTYVGADNIWCFGFSAEDGDTFCDDRTSTFQEDIEWLVGEGITAGCNAAGNRFCPQVPVTRGQLAAFLHRAFGDLVEVNGAPADFTDVDGSVFASDIEWLSASGITRGCGAAEFCPDDFVTRGQLAAFLVRALGLSDMGERDLFIDDDDSVFEGDIDRLATAGITTGCNPPDNDLFCPSDVVTREQIAAFLHRALR
ncbi:MAG: D-alanyl-D-alanine carboxypeptidase family protein [Acidimicrobiia bacterium]|nr:D-alanyl-D-alanine carboxypeptidase family protein [Acidimicrobiia bacterium]